MNKLNLCKISKCRICGNETLFPVVNLGVQQLTGVFPKTKDIQLTSGPLELVKCTVKNSDCCGLVQLLHSYNANEMYGNNYGYRSGLNRSMVDHLASLVREIEEIADPGPGDIIVDIGSNDGTLLKSFIQNGSTLIGIDPTSAKFREYYPEHIRYIPDFFSADKILDVTSGKKAKIITSVAMFYDLEDPCSFAREVCQVLDEEGLWVLEQSYVLSMIENNSYDTICHEHKEYYALKQVDWLLRHSGFKITDLSLNESNGGSIRITAAKNTSKRLCYTSKLEQFLLKEKKLESESHKVWDEFQRMILTHKSNIMRLLTSIRDEGKLVIGYGASTKGNVILQYCGITKDLLPFIAEVNEDKFGSFTPNTMIPIIPESQARSMKPDYFFVLPWHFKDSILKKEQLTREQGTKFIFPLPELLVI